MDYVVVDFNERKREPQVISTTKLRVPDRPFSWLKQAVDLTYYRVWASAPPLAALQLSDTAPLITLGTRIGDERRKPELVDLKLESPEFPLDVILDSATIVDVLDPNLTTVVVNVELGHEFKKGAEPVMKHLAVELRFVPARAEPKLRVTLDSAYKDGFEHVRDARVPLGTLCIENDTAITYAQPLSCTVYFPSSSPLRSIVSFGQPVDATHVEVATPDRITCRGLPPRQRTEVPLFVDLTRVDNPADAERISVPIQWEFYESEEKTVPLQTQEIVFTITRNQQKAVLAVMLDEMGELRPLHSGAVANLEDSMRWSPGRAGWMTCFSVRIGNEAVGGTGGVEIEDLNFDIRYTPGAITWVGNESFLVNRDRPSACPRKHHFSSRVNSHEDFTVSFRHDRISGLPEELAAVRCTISFRYREAAEPAWAGWSEYSSVVSFNLEVDLGREWLGIDFGTSAIVVARGIDGVGEVDPVDLQESLKALVPEREWGPGQVPEFGTKFVSSAVVLVPRKSLNTTNRDESAVSLSPLRTELASSAHPVPYVKALIGMAVMPDLANNLDTFEYSLTPGGAFLNAAKDPVPTDALLRETYDRLLSDLVTPALEGAHPRKVVFSVPNSFTPRHLDQVRQLITTRFPRFKPEYISFISESDAVACYYLANPRLNTRRAGGGEKGGTEYVLVYDMGAGTLDLTYLSIRYEGGHAREVTILGRMGRNTAGNYLDYLIAQEVVALHAGKFMFPMFGKGASPDAVAARHWLKRVVRDEIKPRLDQNETFVLRQPEADGTTPQGWSEYIAGSQELPIPLQDLRRSRGVSDFVRESTEEILHHFFALFPAAPGLPYQPGAVPLHTVVLSGRSMQLRLLRDKVVGKLSEWSGNPDLAVVDNLEAQELKSAVVMGAIQFAALYRRQTPRAPLRLFSRNIQARYGLLYHNPEAPDEWMFKELLNPSTRPVNPEPVTRHGMVVYEYDTNHFDADPGDPRPNLVDLSHAASSYFVQSFSSDTARDANAGRWEYITRMAEFTTDLAVPSVRREAVPVQIKVNRENQMQFHLGLQEDDPVASMRANLTDSSTFRGAMWPFLAGDEP